MFGSTDHIALAIVSYYIIEQMLNSGDHLYGKLLFTWLSLVMPFMVSFCVVLFLTRCLGIDLGRNWRSFSGFSFLLFSTRGLRTLTCKMGSTQKRKTLLFSRRQANMGIADSPPHPRPLLLKLRYRTDNLTLFCRSSSLRLISISNLGRYAEVSAFMGKVRKPGRDISFPIFTRKEIETKRIRKEIKTIISRLNHFLSFLSNI